MMTTLTADDGHILDCSIVEPRGETRGGIVILQEGAGRLIRTSLS
jgi:hypothetical protein